MTALLQSNVSTRFSRVSRVLLAAAVVLPLAVTGCSNAKRSLGLDKSSPDEFKVVTRAPLALPPDYNLRPPSPGADRPQETQPRQAARQALIGNGTAIPSGPTVSSGESALLARAGADAAIPDIRQVVNRETSALAEESKSFTDRLVFWREEEQFGTAVDPDAESQRLRENQAMGNPVTQGRTPSIERREQGILEGLF